MQDTYLGAQFDETMPPDKRAASARRIKRLIAEKLRIELARSKPTRFAPATIYPVDARREAFTIFGDVSRVWNEAYVILARAEFKGKLWRARREIEPYRPLRDTETNGVMLYTSGDMTVPKGYVLVPYELTRPKRIAEFIAIKKGANPEVREVLPPTTPDAPKYDEFDDLAVILHDSIDRIVLALKLADSAVADIKAVQARAASLRKEQS
jgi:hypothetical protein